MTNTGMLFSSFTGRNSLLKSGKYSNLIKLEKNYIQQIPCRYWKKMGKQKDIISF